MKEIIYKNNKSLRLDTFLQSKYPLLKVSNLNKFSRENKIKVNGKKSALNIKLSNNDIISLYLSENYFEIPTKETAYMFSGKNLDIIYEDENILLVNKPSGIAVCDDNWQNYDTLINRVINHYFLSGKQLSFTPDLCHRLDTGTCGIVVLAKNKPTLEFLLELFKTKSIQKKYICVCEGKPVKKDIVEKAYLIKNSAQSYVSIHKESKSSNAKEIQTGIHLTNFYKNYSLLDIELFTGRTHQIRAHLSFLNLPILGDSRYGNNTLNRKLRLKYQLLCSYYIRFGKIENPDFSYLSEKEFSIDYPWFVESFKKQEFL